MPDPTDTDTIPSPASVAPIRLKDSDCDYAFVEFPPDTIFLESVSTNTTFRPHTAYAPAQRIVNGVEETHLYSITPGEPVAKHIAGPLAAPDGSTDVTVFGSALTSSGLWYLCAFNRNSIICVDLSKVETDSGTTSAPQPITALWEVGELPSPNDVCYDPQDETTLYVVGGTFSSVLCMCEFSNSARGNVYRVNVAHPDAPVVSIQATSLRTLAGVEVVGDTLWIAQLYDVLTQPKTRDGQSQAKAPPQVVWQGEDGQQKVWLADNIDVTDKGLILCPAYSTVPKGTVQTVMQRGFLMSAVLFYYQISTAFMRGESFQEAIRDPEVSLSFSNTYIKEGEPPQPVRLVIFDPANGGRPVHFEIDMADTRQNFANTTVKNLRTGETLGQRYHFNEQVTHTGHLRGKDGQGYLCFVNFECPRILLLKEDPFLRHV